MLPEPSQQQFLVAILLLPVASLFRFVCFKLLTPYLILVFKNKELQDVVPLHLNY
jgi:hypothetical protein